MRLSILILSFALPPVAALAASPPGLADSRLKCPSDRSIFADETGNPARARKLGELPPGRLYLSVDRRIGNCRRPVIIRYGIGATSAPTRPD
jgi:hypothetical protein